MADGKKIYSIEINGIKESVTQVEALRRQLDELEKRVNALKGQSVNVTSTSSIDTQALAEEAKLRKQIDALEAKSVTYNSEIYQSYLAQKEQLDKVLQDQKQIAASERLQADNYTNTITGLKEKLRDLKRVMATMDISDEMFGDLVRQANDVNNKLKEIEQSYGQFGRNVGNYKSAVEEFKQLTITVDGVERSFTSAREAYRTLKNERDTMALTGKRETEQFKELDRVVKTLQSDINDLSKSSAQMDRLLDTMESFTAIGGMAQGFSALFGFDDDKIQKSIQKLLALQSILKGFEVINKQIQTGEGLGKYFNMLSEACDNAAKKVASVTSAVTGLGPATEGASKGVKALGMAFKGLMAIGIVAFVMLVADALQKLYEQFKNANKWFDDYADAIKNARVEHSKAKAEITAYRKVVEGFNGTQKEQKVLVDELNSKFGSTLGTYKSLAEWLDVLRTKTNAYSQALGTNIEIQEHWRNYQTALEKQMEFEADYDKAFNYQGESFLEKLNSYFKREGMLYDYGGTDFLKGNFSWLWGDFGDEGLDRLHTFNENISKERQRLQKEVDHYRRIWEDTFKAGEKEKKDGQLFGYAPNYEDIQAESDRAKQAIIEAENVIMEARLMAMKDGFYKTVIELNRERDERIKTIREAYGKYSKQELELISIYNKQILDEREKLDKEIEKTYKKVWDDINDETLVGQRKNLELLEQGLEEYTKQAEESLRKDLMPGLLSTDYSENINAVQQYYNKRTELEVRNIENLNLRTIALYKKEAKDEEDALVDKYNTMIFEAEKYYKERLQFIDDQERLGMLSADEANQERLENEKRYQKAMTTQYANYEQQKQQIAEDLEAKITQTERDNLEKRREIVSREYDEMISIINNAYTEINNETRNLTVVDSFGIINLRKTKEQTERVKELFRNLRRNLIAEKARIEALFKDGLISPEDFERWMKELDQKIKDIDLASDLDTADWQDWLKSIQVYVQAASQTINSILDAVGAQMDANYEKQLDELDRMNEAIEKKLDEQEDIIEKHRDAIDDIEDELATARGDRRQHLIDMLNAEIVAQREAQAERERLQKEQEAIEKRQEKVEADRRKSEKKIAIAQATISTAQAVTNALAVKPYTLGIILAAAAAVQGAAQIATIKATKYADGGVLQGPSHSQGGIKVLGGTAEVEGKEFITNKATTARNTDLLYFINSKKRRINLDDFIEFYSGKVKSNVKAVKTKYADGGVLPGANVDIKEQLQNVVIDRDDRPIYVSVVDINNAQDRVRNVQALAGLKND